MPSPNPTNRQSLSNMEKLRQALILRRGGATFQQIADAGLYSDRKSAQRAIMKWYRKQNDEIGHMVDEMRQEDLDRIDTLLRSVWSRATDPQAEKHLQYFDRACVLMRQRARLMGLDKPQQHELSGPGGGSLIPPSIDLSQLSAEQLQEVQRILSAAVDG